MTKNNPGVYDCYANAEPDEPVFVLLGRDPLAAILVGMWAEMRARMPDADEAKLQEALDCAAAMKSYVEAHKPIEKLGAARDAWVATCTRIGLRDLQDLVENELKRRGLDPDEEVAKEVKRRDEAGN